MSIPSIECPYCHAVSYNRNDIQEKYCGRCHRFQDGNVVVMDPPNTQPPAKHVWAFMSEDEQGRQNMCGSIVGTMGLQPLVTANPEVLELMRPLARQLQAATPKLIKLIRFSNPEEILNW